MHYIYFVFNIFHFYLYLYFLMFNVVFLINICSYRRDTMFWSGEKSIQLFLCWGHFACYIFFSACLSFIYMLNNRSVCYSVLCFVCHAERFLQLHFGTFLSVVFMNWLLFWIRCSEELSFISFYKCVIIWCFD